MDYFGILKRAWEVTWRYKILWVLGFFAVTSSSTNSTSNMNSWQENYGSTDVQPAFDWAEQNIGVIVALGVLVLIVVLVMFVLGIAARGGLVHLVNEAEERRQVRLADGWRVGFRYWGRTFMIGFLLGLPFVLLAAGMGIMLFGAGLGLAASADSASAVGGIGFGGAMCCLMPVFIILLIATGIVVGIVGELALRYSVLQDVSFGQAIRRGWDDMLAKKGAFVMWAVMLLPAFAYGIALFFVAIVTLIPGILMIVSGAVLIGVVALMLVTLLLMVPGAVYNTFFSASWTIFFRRMTGAEVVAAVSQTGVAQGYMPPPPSAPPAPPSTPPAAPAVEQLDPSVSEDGSEA